MRILFCGDSLTEGSLGVSYVDSLQARFPQHQMINYGQGGDTVLSLYRRLQELPEGESYDLAFLWVGVNDIFQKVRWHYRILAWLRKQPRAKSTAEFRERYAAALDLLAGKAKRVVAASPMILGEEVDNRWNPELARLSEIVALLAKERERVIFVDLHLAFAGRLASRPVSSYLPDSAVQVLRDSRELEATRSVDQISEIRGLHYTLDGVHLNSAGAKVVADLFSEWIEKMMMEESRTAAV